MELRNPTLDELRLIDFLIRRAKGFNPQQDWKNRLKVRDMNDGGMGSLLLFLGGEEKSYTNRGFGKQISECQFEDQDATHVIASLNLDKNGELFELDIWKTNFGKLVRIPDEISETLS